MITCNKCGFGHKTVEELRACKSWAEMQTEAPAPAQPDIELANNFKKSVHDTKTAFEALTPAQPAPPAEPSAKRTTVSSWGFSGHLRVPPPAAAPSTAISDPLKHSDGIGGACPGCEDCHPAISEPPTHLPEQYRGRWSYEYSEKRECFQICTGWFCVAEAEDSEVADFICNLKNKPIATPAISEEEVARQATDSIAMRTADWFTGDSANRKDAIFALVKQDVEAAIRKVSGPLREQLTEANDMIQQYKFAVVKAERQLELCREKYDAAMSYANGRWSEWGERAGTVADLLDELGAALQPGQKGGKG